jgi:hypothetical protein
VSLPTGIITPKDQVDQRNSITDENIPSHDCRRGSRELVAVAEEFSDKGWGDLGGEVLDCGVTGAQGD